MLYRIRLDLAFTDLDPANDILDKAIDHLSSAVTIHPGQIYQEEGFISIERCFHDEDPTIPCQIIAKHTTS